MLFHYQVLDERGKSGGEPEADSARHARQRLREQGLVPLALVEGLNEARRNKRGWRISGRVE